MTAPQTTKKRRGISRAAANTFGSLGYTSLLLQWAWALLLYTPYLLDTPVRHLLLPPESGHHVNTFVPPTLEVSPLLIGIAATITVIVLIFTVITVIRLPKTIGSTGKKITHVAASSVIPVITKHQPIKRQARRKLTAKIVAYLKLLLIMLPLIGILPAHYLPDLPLDAIIVLIVATVAGIASIVCFGLQYLIARIRNIPASLLW